jgi:2-dehydro-3-deoxygluconokinase
VENHVRVVTFGEVMLVIRPEAHKTLERARWVECLVGGSEANVAVGLTRLGISSAWISKMPDNPIARGMVNTIRGLGVNTTGVVWVENKRVGIMFVEIGSYPRLNRVIYDREGSAASTLSPRDIDWDFVKKSEHLHLTGITAALSRNCAETVQKAKEVAKQANLTVSFDVNYRANLWSPNKAREILVPLLRDVDVLFVSREEAKTLFSVDGDANDSVAELKQKFNSRVVVMSLGENGCVALSDKIYKASIYQATVVNRFGVGDAFDSGFISGFLENDIQKGLDYGAAAAAIKLSMPDENFPLITREDVDNLVKSGCAGQVPNQGNSAVPYGVKR